LIRLSADNSTKHVVIAFRGSANQEFQHVREVAAVHEQNLVHRDIKPTNIMVRLKEERGVTAQIIDLGLAKTLDESASEAGISSLLSLFAATS
jgi:serine/threonine protein kinase